MKKLTVLGVTLLALTAAPVFAQSGSISIPGLGSGSGSMGSDVTNTKITVANNKAESVRAGGGTLNVTGMGGLSMQGVANVNSVNITGSRVKDSTISVTGNEAKDINAIGGVANVNSVNIN